MNQYQWTFLDNERRRHNVGIAHSPKSGHLVVYCDARVVLIEFKVLAARTFPFFIEDELCKLSVEGSKAAGFTYDFHIDTEVDTEVNRLRNEAKRRRRRSTWIRASALALLGVVFVSSIAYWGHRTSLHELPLILRGEGIRAEASVTADGEFEFVAGASVVSGRPIGGDDERLAPLPLAAGAQVPILYGEADPDYFVVDWRYALAPLAKPDEAPTDVSAAVVRHLSADLPVRAGGAACALQVAERLGGLSGRLSLIDAYVADDPEDLTRWRERFAEPAYHNRLRQVCPPPAAAKAPE